MPLKIYCRNCVQYRDEWCKAISDSPDPDLMRDCGFYRDKTLFNLDKVKVNDGMKEVKGYNPSKDPRLINCKTECGNERCFAKRYGLFAERTCPYFTEPLAEESPCEPPIAIKSGKWGLCLSGVFACTNCGVRAKKKTNYCPNCGADMREEI